MISALYADCDEELVTDNESACCRNYSVNADFLYWRVYQDGLNCGSRRDNDRWNAGYRLGIGSESTCYNLRAFWTHFETPSECHNRRHSSKLHYDTLDFLIGNSYCVNSCLSLEPSFGLRFAEIRQHVRFHDISEQLCSSGDSFVTTDFKEKDKFYGVGPEFNLGGNLDIGCRLNLFAEIGASVLYGHFKNREQRRESFDNPEDVCECRSHCHKNVCLGVVDATIGIEWNTCICKNTDLLVRLAWEHHRYLRFQQANNNGDLSFDGMSLSARVSF